MDTAVVLHTKDRPHSLRHTVYSIEQQDVDCVDWHFISPVTSNGNVDEDDVGLVRDILRNTDVDAKLWFDVADAGILKNHIMWYRKAKEHYDFVYQIEDDIVLGDEHIRLAIVAAKENPGSLISMHNGNDPRDYAVPDDLDVLTTKEWVDTSAHGMTRGAFEILEDDLERYFSLIPDRAWSGGNMDSKKVAEEFDIPELEESAGTDRFLKHIARRHGVTQWVPTVPRSKDIGVEGIGHSLGTRELWMHTVPRVTYAEDKDITSFRYKR